MLESSRALGVGRAARRRPAARGRAAARGLGVLRGARGSTTRARSPSRRTSSRRSSSSASSTRRARSRGAWPRSTGHPWAELAARRCAALADDGDLGDVAAGYERLGLRFDAARCLLAHGRAERRQRRWRAARDALGEAAARFDALGSPGWADLARAELARVGGRRPRADGELTKTEAQVAELAARGHSNKEIAHALFVTVHTVEAHLSSTYAKLGVRSRGQLAGRLKIGDPGNFAGT